MKKLVLAAALVSSVAFAAEPAKADAKAADTKTGDANANPMANWKPKKVTKKDTKGIDALYKQMEEAWKKGDLETVASMHDFPIYMMTDDSAGVVKASEWTKEQFTQVMKPMFENMPKDMKMTTKPKATFITDTMAFVEEEHSMTPPKGKEEKWVSEGIVIMKDGKWMMKGGAEGGWGDMPMPEKKAEAAPAAKEPGTKTAAAPAKK